MISSSPKSRCKVSNCYEEIDNSVEVIIIALYKSMTLTS